MPDLQDYPSHRNLPTLAGLCSMQRAVNGDWSLDESTNRLKRLHFVLKRLHEILTSKITAEPIYELKTAYSYHAYLFAEHVSLIRTRVGEMREPPLELDKVPHPALGRLLSELECAPETHQLLSAVYQIVVPLVIQSCEKLSGEAHPLADAPTVRVAKWIAFELSDVVRFGDEAIRCLIDEAIEKENHGWIVRLNELIQCAGGLDGTGETSEEIPAAWFSVRPAVYHAQPRRDERFIDPYNAGVNAEAFLYDERFSAQDKTLMMYYKRIRELDVPEMMASILVELREDEPWEFHREMSRQLWDEARHAMMGEVGFASIGIDWRNIPINFTWSRNLNLQLDARERHGVLFFIEQNLMPKTGKRYEWEVASESGDPLSKVFQDFDWADEVLHAQIGRRWYVPRYDSLKEALSYGDQCWSKVMSQWQEYLDEGLTRHTNWWPDLYRTACMRWGKEPDEQTLAFDETYEDKRADLERIW